MIEMGRLSCFVILFISLVHVDARHKMELTPADEGQSKLIKELGLLSTEVCQLLPSDFEADCLEAANAYVHRTRLLVKGNFNEESLSNSTEVTDEHACTACRRSVKDIFTGLNHPKMRMKIMEGFIEYCEEMEYNARDCKEKIYEYAPKVLSKLERLKTSNLCSMMGFCDEEITVK